MILDPERHEAAALLARFPDVPACHVVEIGCGDGRVTRRYADRVASVLAIDSDSEAIAAFLASGVGDNVEVRALSVDRLDLPDACADTVLLSWSL